MGVLDTKASIQAREEVLGSPLQGPRGDLMGLTAHEEQLQGLVSWGQLGWGRF